MAKQREQLSLTDRELFYRLGWFTKLRWAMGGMALLILLISGYVLGISFRRGGGAATMVPAVEVVLVIFLYNAAFTFAMHIVKLKGQITRRLIMELALGQLVCDMLATCVLAHFTGGIENFFIIFILLPVTIAAELLPQSLAYVMTGSAVILINALAWGEQQGILPHTFADLPLGPDHLYAEPLYVLEATASLTVMIFATAFVASSISKRLRAREAELEDAYEALREADQTKSFFMRKAGHEMRAPLAAVHTILETIVQSSDALKNEHNHLIRRAQKRIHALMKLVDDLRRYSRLRSSRNILQTRRICVADVVKETVELFRQQAQDANLSLHCSTEPIWLDGDEELLREVITNLLANAIQYTPAGGRIEVKLVANRQQAVLTVADTGIGIHDEARERLFEEFYRSREARQMIPEGTGLGLAITKRIVEMHGGEIDFTSTQERGTTFRVQLPLASKGIEP